MTFQNKKLYPLIRKAAGLSLSLLLLLAGFAAAGQSYQTQARSKVPGLEIAYNTLKDGSSRNLKPANEGSGTGFEEAARKHKIPTRQFKDIPDMLQGYYIIAGVFGEKRNARNFLLKLKAQGFQPKSIHHPGNNLNYVYLEYHTNGQAAIRAVLTRLDESYREKLWIMDVRGHRLATPTPAAKSVGYQETTAKEGISGFAEATREQAIPTRSIPALKGIHPGYYLIAGVFGEAANAGRFTAQLKKLSPDAGQFFDSSKQAFYVHLAYSKSWQPVLQDAATRLNGRYSKNLWILEVKADFNQSNIPDGTPTLDLQFQAPVNPDHEYLPPVKTETLVGLERQKDPPGLGKLIEKADAHFAKMQYAEAAELYELALKQSAVPSFDMIRKAGDAHYFNTNMDRAYYWYDQLYSRYKDEMSAENLFKYAHALKGNGKYGRAKRITRLYNREIQKEATDWKERPGLEDSREVLLDNILGTEEQVTILNLAVNSIYSDFAPMFHNDNELVYASAADSSFFTTRRYKWNNQPFLDLYVGKLNQESPEVRDAVKFSRKVNTKYHEAGVTFSPDNHTMYFTRNNFGKKLKRDKNGINNLKIYQSRKADGEWGEAVELPFNSDEYSTGHPALSPDGKQLYFVSDMPGTIGGTDIFVVDVGEDGSFSEPRNLGPGINTEGKEMFPFINESKLYFSSDGHVGLGGLDIFEVPYSGEEGFLEVRNLGKPINSNKDDFSFIVKEATQQGYFASNRKGGKGDDDIYSFERLPLEETNNNAIAGVITEELSGDTVPEALIELLDENNRKLKELVTGQDGTFMFEDLEGSTKYIIRVNRQDFKPLEKAVATLENQKVEIEVALSRLEDRILVEEGIKKLRTDMIYFDFDRYSIRPDAAVELDKLVGIMQEYPEMIIRIESHTDSRGPAVYNKYLSDQRAKASRTYLIEQGIAADRIESATGYGEERLLNGCNGSVRCTASEHERNRRSEFIIVNM